MKSNSYTCIKREDITACKEMFRTIIKRLRAKGYQIGGADVRNACYDICKFFDCMSVDFRCDFEEWAINEVKKRV